MTRLAAVDCGTNSLRLLICEVSDGAAVREIHRAMEIVRLGEGVDAHGEFSAAALERTRAVLERYVEIMEIERVAGVRMVATSATRDARNRDDFFQMTRELLGRITPGAEAEVISGEEEAELSFRGAVADMDTSSGPVCVIDLGGGSTEFVVGSGSGEISGSHSAQMGCVRLTERFLHSNPPTAREIGSARTYVTERLAEVCDVVPVAQAQTFVGCAGTFTTLAALALGLESYDPHAIHGSVLRFDALRVLTDQVIAESAQQRATNPVIHSGRADVLGGGAVVVQGIIDVARERAGVEEITISEKDLLDGIIAGLAQQL